MKKPKESLELQQLGVMANEIERAQWKFKRKYGTLGPASPVRKISVEQYLKEKKKP